MGKKFEIAKTVSKLRKLLPNSESIQETANYFFAHKKHGEEIVQLWLEVYKKADDKSRLTLIYLANEVLQTCKRMNAPVFRHAWQPHLENCMSQLSSKAIIEKVIRTVNVWRERAVYEDDYLNSLLKCLQGRRAPQTEDDMATKIIESFNPDQPIELLQQLAAVEGELTQQVHHLDHFRVDPRIYAEDTNLFLQRIKDKEQGRKFVNRLSDDCHRLDVLRQTLDKEISLRKKLTQVLHNAEVFYEHQMKEVDVVTNAYKDYGRRLEEVKKELLKQQSQLPEAPATSNPTNIPLFSYLGAKKAPAPATVPVTAALSTESDTHEPSDVVGMDIDDDEIGDQLEGFEDAPSPGNTPPHMKQGIQRVLNALDDGADSEDDDSFFAFAAFSTSKVDVTPVNSSASAVEDTESPPSKQSQPPYSVDLDEENTHHRPPPPPPPEPPRVIPLIATAPSPAVKVEPSTAPVRNEMHAINPEPPSNPLNLLSNIPHLPALLENIRHIQSQASNMPSVSHPLQTMSNRISLGSSGGPGAHPPPPQRATTPDLDEGEGGGATPTMDEPMESGPGNNNFHPPIPLFSPHQMVASTPAGGPFMPPRGMPAPPIQAHFGPVSSNGWPVGKVWSPHVPPSPVGMNLPMMQNPGLINSYLTGLAATPPGMHMRNMGPPGGDMGHLQHRHRPPQSPMGSNSLMGPAPSPHHPPPRHADRRMGRPVYYP